MTYTTEQERIDARKASVKRYNDKNKQSIRKYNKDYKIRMSDNLFINASKRINTLNRHAKTLGHAPITCSKARVLSIMATQTTCCHCGSEGPLDLDHCHETGKARGMLCRPCNVKDVLK